MQLTEKICTRPFAADWDGDGHLDLVVGNFSGTFYWFKGEGKGKFEPKPEQITSGGKPLKIAGVHSDPFVIDWDGDGDLDLVSGSSDGGVYWAENKAGKGKMPDLGPLKALIDTPPKWGTPSAALKPLREGDLTRPTYATRVWVDDINGDGKLDLLVGDSVTLVSPANGLSDEEMMKKYAEWQEEFKKAQAALNAVQIEEAKERKDAKDARTTRIARSTGGGRKKQKEEAQKKEEARKKAYEEYRQGVPEAVRVHEGRDDRLRVAIPAEVTPPAIRLAPCSRLRVRLSGNSIRVQRALGYQHRPVGRFFKPAYNATPTPGGSWAGSWTPCTTGGGSTRPSGISPRWSSSSSGGRLERAVGGTIGAAPTGLTSGSQESLKREFQ